jgi:hemolysin activation/secretion protein
MQFCCLKPALIFSLAALGAHVMAQDSVGLSVKRQADQQRLETLRERTQQGPYNLGGAQSAAVSQPDFQDMTCLDARQVQIVGSTLIPAPLLNHWVATMPKYDGCITVGSANLLLYRLSTWYLEQGYVTSQPISFRVDDQGTLVILVVEGAIEKIETTDPRISPSGLFQPPVDQQHRVLNLRDVEQAVDQINRLDTRRVAVDIEPGQQPGTSVLRLRPQDALPRRDWSVRSSVDNHDAEQIQGTLSFSVDNLFGKNENLYVSHGRELSKSQQMYRTYSALFNVPNGYSTYSFSLYRSDSEVPIVDEQRAKTQRHSWTLQWRHVFHRSQQEIAAATLALTHDQSRQAVGDTVLQTSSWSNQHATVGLEYYRQQAAWRGHVRLALDQGLGLGSPVYETLPENNYVSAEIQAQLVVPFSSRWYLSTQLRTQYSPDYVPGFRQFWIGGTQLVPGFRHDAYAGNSGTIAQLQLNWQPANTGWPQRWGMMYTNGRIHGDEQSVARHLSSIGLQYQAEWRGFSGTVALMQPTSSSKGVISKGPDLTWSMSYQH